MKRIRIVGIAILVLSLCIILGITAWADSSNVLTYSVTTDKTVVCGDKDDTVTLTIGIDKTDVPVDSIEFWVTVPDGWVIESVKNEAVTFAAGGNTAYGLFSWYNTSMESVPIDYVAKITVKIPAGTAAGDYAITVSKVDMIQISGGTWQNITVVPDEITSTIKVGHTPETDKAVDPTCTNPGLTAGSHCSVCGETLVAQTPIDVLGHKNADPIIGNETAATCTKDGGYDTIILCKVCGEELSRVHTVIPAKGHTAGETVVENNKAPTCTEDGSYDNVVYCTVCDAELSRKTETVTATGHSYNAVVTDPTCTEAGYTTHTCSACGDKYTDTPVDATGHDYDDGVVTTDPTCTTEGVKTYTCATCGGTKTEAVGATGHTAGETVVENNKAPTCTVDGSYDNVVYCTVCKVELSRNTVTVTATGHTAGETVVENNKPATCTVEGSYDNVVYCTVCETELSRETETVSVVPHTPGTAVEENRVGATCTTEGSYDSVVYCTECDAELSREAKTIPVVPHTPGTAVKENNVDPDCENDGSYEMATYCTVCGKELSRETTTVDALGHKYESTVTNPTCTDKGYTTHTCSVCNDSYVDTYVDALGHTYDEGVVTTEPTCTEKGVKTFTCACGDSYTEDVAALGHKEGTAVEENRVGATCTTEGSYDSVVYCTVCGEELSRKAETIPVVPHTPGTAVKENNEDPDCENEGSYEMATYCTVCGAELSRETTTVDALGHKYVAVTTPSTCATHGDITYTCSVCEDEYTDMIEQLDPNNHEGTKVHYNKFNANTHSAIYVCCGAPYVTNEPHAFDEETALCVCGVAKKFTFTIYGMDGKTIIYTNQVSYGAKIFSWVDKMVADGYYGTSLTITKALTIGSEVDYWADDAIMPKGDVAIQAYWSGWTTDEIGTKYILENEISKGWFEVDGGYYYADPATEYIVTGTKRVPYPAFAINGITYAPNAEDVAYAESKGRVFIDAESAWFVFGTDGKFQSGMTDILDGKYVKNGMIAWHAGLVEFDGELYYFVGDPDNGGNKFANGNVWATRTNGLTGLEKGACYNFKDGKLSGLEGIVGDNYFKNSEMMYGAGLVKLGDKYIYVRSNGNIVKNANYYIPKNDLGIVSASYFFDENGYMVSPNTNLYTGVDNGIYYVDGKVGYGAGLIEWNDNIYYVRSNGKVATGKYYVTNVNDMEGFTSGQKLYFDEDGKLIPIKNGIVEEDEVLYYYENNSLKCGEGVVELVDDNGDVYYIYVRSNGQLATGKYWPTTLNGYLERGEYDWGVDGKYYPGK